MNSSVMRWKLWHEKDSMGCCFEKREGKRCYYKLFINMVLNMFSWWFWICLADGLAVDD